MFSTVSSLVEALAEAAPSPPPPKCFLYSTSMSPKSCSGPMIAMSGMKKKRAAVSEKQIVEIIRTANLVKNVSVHIQSIVPEPSVVNAPDIKSEL